MKRRNQNITAHVMLDDRVPTDSEELIEILESVMLDRGLEQFFLVGWERNVREARHGPTFTPVDPQTSSANLSAHRAAEARHWTAKGWTRHFRLLFGHCLGWCGRRTFREFLGRCFFLGGHIAYFFFFALSIPVILPAFFEA
jgi:hypothetical protein